MMPNAKRWHLGCRGHLECKQCRTTLPTAIVGGLNSWEGLENLRRIIYGGGGIINCGGWKSLTKKFEFTQNLH